MEKETIKKLEQWLKAFKAMHQAVERTIHTGMGEGVEETIFANYRQMHGQVAELLPDDYYVTEVLALQQESLNYVQLQLTQMVAYLKETLREHDSPMVILPDVPRPPEPPTPPFNPRMNLGRDIQEEVMAMTRSTLQRALRGIEIDTGPSHNLSGEDLRGADLSGQTLSGYNLSRADLSGANMQGARLNGANLAYANLEEADLREASLLGANLNGANLAQALLDGANLNGAVLPDGERYQHGVDLSVYTDQPAAE